MGGEGSLGRVRFGETSLEVGDVASRVPIRLLQTSDLFPELSNLSSVGVVEIRVGLELDLKVADVGLS